MPSSIEEFELELKLSSANFLSVCTILSRGMLIFLKETLMAKVREIAWSVLPSRKKLRLLLYFLF